MYRNVGIIRDYFEQFIFGFIYHDIEQCIKNGANYVVALALLSYTEYFGGLVSGNLGLKPKSKQNFNEALSYFPKEYQKIDSSVEVNYLNENGKESKEKGIYSLFRCGLVHEYFVKGFATIYNNPEGLAQNHIGIVKAEYKIELRGSSSEKVVNKVFEFYTNEYFRDFRYAVQKVFELVIEEDASVLRLINQSLNRVYARRVVWT